MKTINLTSNEKKVLKRLIEDGRIRCTNIAKELGISPQAVCKIQAKLEKAGIIKGYSARVDYGALGLEVFAIVCFDFKEGLVSPEVGREIYKRSQEAPHMLEACTVGEDECSHVALYGFRSPHEADHYLHEMRKGLQRATGEAARIRKAYKFSNWSVLKHDWGPLLIKLIDELSEDRISEPEMSREPFP